MQQGPRNWFWAVDNPREARGLQTPPLLCSHSSWGSFLFLPPQRPWGGRRPPRRNAQRPRWLGCFLPSLPLCQSLAAAVRAPPTLCSSHLPAALRAGSPSSCQSPGMGGPPLAALSPEGKLVNIQSSLRDSSSPGPGSDLGIGSFRGSPGNPAGQRSLGTPRRHPF